MRYLARTTEGRALLGDEAGYVRLSSVYPDAAGVRDVLPATTDGLENPDVGYDTRRRPEQLDFGPFLASPGKLFGIGLNYEAHASDLDESPPEEPASFFKPHSAVTGPGGPIRLPPSAVSDTVTAEAELAVIIGRTCRNVTPETAADVIAGYAPVIDVTAEDVLRRNPRFLTRAKSFDTFLVLGPHIAVPESGAELGTCEVRTVVNDDVAAANEIANMHFSPRELVAFHSEVMTLEPGDVISTGTPGAQQIQSGDTVRAEVDTIGAVSAAVVR